MKYTPQQWIAFADWDDGLPGSVDPKGALSGVKVSDIYRAHAAALERIEKLENALRPFSKFACDEPCKCHNCIARDVLKEPR